MLNRYSKFITTTALPLIMAVASFIGFAGRAGAQAQRYNITDLNILFGTNDLSFNAINNRNQFVGSINGNNVRG